VAIAEKCLERACFRVIFVKTPLPPLLGSFLWVVSFSTTSESPLPLELS
jgi:hypothetical protein